MLYSYSLSRRQAWICRLASGLFLAVATLQAAALLFALAMPNTNLRWHCGPAGCALEATPQIALTAEQLEAIGAPTGSAAGLISRLHRPEVRLASAAIDILHRLPLVALLLCVAVALRRLSGLGDDDLSRALPWLRRASICTLLYALLPPLAASARTSLLLSALGPRPVFAAELELGAILVNLLLASLAFTVTWALASGNRARRDLAEII